MKVVLLTLCAAWLTCGAGAAVRLGTPFNDGMVLQRDRPVPVWGEAKPGETVTVAFAGQSKSATAAADGVWRVTLDPLPASTEGRTMSVTTPSTPPLHLKDILVGEVWFAGGQSNMDCPISGQSPRYRDRHGAMLAQITHLPRVRYAYAKGSWNKTPQAFNGRLAWKRLEPKNLLSDESRGQMSAVAFYFARELYLALGVPIGIIEAHVGGTGIVTWTPHAGFGTRPDLKDYDEWTYYDEKNWPREKKEFDDYPMTDPCQQPSGYYNGIVHPLVPYACRGMIWYQGCHNYKDPERYASMMHALHDGYRMAFGDPHFRLYYAQLASGSSKVALQQAQYAREAQDAAMAVISDYDNPADVHPWDKEPVSRRLVLKALKRDYGFTDIEDSSPVPTSFSVSNDVVTVKLAHAKGLYLYNPDRSLKNNFRLAGADGKWVKAEILNFVCDESVKSESRKRNGRIVGEEVRLRAPGVVHPVQIDYHFLSPVVGEIYNGANLPLGAFRENLTGGCSPWEFSPADATNAYRVAEILVRDHTPRDAATPQGAAAAQAIADELRARGQVPKLVPFSAETREGTGNFVNVCCEVPGLETAPWIVLVSHYDTKRGVPMPGANDGASTSGLLVALADAVRRVPNRRMNFLFVWTDGEECAGADYAPNDGLHGSRHAAAALRASGRKVRAVLCLDMLGDRDLNITVPANGDATLRALVRAAAGRAGLESSLTLGAMQVIDDHVPFCEAGFPAIDLIDFAYGSRPGANDYWHTAADTLDKISIASLETSGRIVVAFISLVHP